MQNFSLIGTVFGMKGVVIRIVDKCKACLIKWMGRFCSIFDKGIFYV